MNGFWRGAKQVPWWAYLLAVAAIIGVIVVSPSEEPTKVVESTPKAKPKPTLTAAELVKFDNKVVELDPDEKLVTGVSQWEDSTIVSVSVTLGFATMPKIQQGEIAIAMRDGLAKICECRPYLKFETEAGQRVVEIGRGQPKYP